MSHHTETTDIAQFGDGFVAVGGNGASGEFFHYGNHPIVTTDGGKAAVWIGRWFRDGQGGTS